MQPSHTDSDGKWRGPKIVVVETDTLNPATALFKMDLMEYYGLGVVNFTAPNHNPTEFFDPQFGGCVIYVYNDNEKDKIAEFFASQEINNLPLRKVLAINGSEQNVPEYDFGQDETIFFLEDFKPGGLNVSFRQCIGLPLTEKPTSIPITDGYEPTRQLVRRTVNARLSAMEPLEEMPPEIEAVYQADQHRFDGAISSTAIIFDVHGWNGNDD